ncbi:MAG: hypothetical protein AAB152_04235 [Candidatus Coatesbacteria bacterium]
MLSALILFVSAATGAAAAPPPPLIATLSAPGVITIRDGAREVAWIGAGCFLPGWRWREPATGRCDGRGSCAGTIGLGDDRSASATVTVTAAGRTLTLAWDFAPSASVAVESLHASLTVPVEDWFEAPFTVAGTRGRISTAHPASIHLGDGTGTRMTLGPRAPGGRTLTVTTASRTALGLQDSRQWGGRLDLRIGGLRSRVWKARERVRIRFTLAFDRPVKLVYDRPVKLEASADWIPLDGSLDIAPGSALDWSGMPWRHEPAGSRGWVRAGATNPGAFEFEKAPGIPARFNGANLCFEANFPDHAAADRLAERFARLGWNTMRIHHYETSWGDIGGLVDRNAGDSLTFNPEALDRFDYFFAAMKKRGIYLTTDLYVNRRVLASEIFDGGEGDVAYRFKQLVAVSDRAMANWREFARRLLTHVNPYTNLAYRDDPALAWISLINEGDLMNSPDELVRDPREKALWDAAFAKWKRETGSTGEWGSEPWKRFMWELQRATDRKMIAFLRDELGVNALLTDINAWADQWGAQVVRADFGYVDNHFYWDHPNFIEKDWSLPSRGGSGSGSAIESGGGLNDRCLNRLLDRPFTVTEWNYAGPNPNRAEGGLVAGALAAVQDWGGLWRFAYSHGLGGMLEPVPAGYFDSATDPLRLASEYAVTALFLRGDIPPAKHAVAVAGTAAEWMAAPGTWCGGDLNALGFVVRVGTLAGGTPGADALALPLAEGFAKGNLGPVIEKLRGRGFLPAANATRPDGAVLESEGGEIRLERGAGVFSVAAPRTAGLAGPEGTDRALGALTVKLTKSRAAIWATSLDGKPLDESGRILLVHLTDLQNTGETFRGQDRKVLEAWGKMPWLVAAGSASVRLTRKSPGALEVWRLDLSGKRISKVPVKANGTGVAFEVSTGPDATLYYEVLAP